MKRIASVLVLFLILFQGVVRVHADTVTASTNEAVLDFPTSITFNADLTSTTKIVKVKLHYGTTQDTCGSVSAMAFPDVTPDLHVTAQWKWDMRQSGGEPPGATIWWQWETIDSNGKSQLTERKQITWIDNIHPWQEIDEGLIHLHHYYSNPDNGKQLADNAVTALKRLSTDIGIAPDKPIDLYIYASNQDMKDAIFYEPGWTGGQAYPEYNIVIIGINADDPTDFEWGKSTEAHEMTHVLAGDYTFSCLGDTPTWLTEGLAVYGEGGPRQEWVPLFEQNKEANTLLTFKVLSSSFSEDPNAADLSYSQSYYMVDYLIKQYGKEKMLGLLSAIKSGSELNDALKSVYGFDLNGFETEWRASYGLGPLETSVEQPTPTPTIVPTIIPIQGAKSYAGEATLTATVTPTPSSEVSLLSTPAPTETAGMPAASSQTIFLQQLGEKFHNLVPWILGFFAVNCIILIIVLLVIKQKGDRK